MAYLGQNSMTNLYEAFIFPGVDGITWVDDCLIDGFDLKTPEIIKLTLENDNRNLIYSDDPLADTHFGTHLNSNDPYLIATGFESWNVGENYVATPLGQKTIFIS